MRYLLLIVCGLLAACTLTAEAPTPFPTPDLPTVRFQAPENNDRVYEGVDLTVDIVAQDTTQGIAKIEFFVDGVKVKEGSPPDDEAVEVFRVNMNWLTSGAGALHTLTAIAYRPDGTPSDQETILIEVLAREE
jgi:hypothetical protein